MSKLKTAFKVIVLTGVIAAVAYGAFMAGSYVTAQKWERLSLAYQCGRIDLETKEYAWNDPMYMGIEDLLEQKPTEKGGN